MIPASFITIYGLILVSLTMVLTPGALTTGDRTGFNWQATCYNASVAELPKMLAPAGNQTYRLMDFEEERVEESLH